MMGKASENLMGTVARGPLRLGGERGRGSARERAQRLDRLHHRGQVACEVHHASANHHWRPTRQSAGVGLLAPGRGEDAPPLSTQPVTRVVMEESAAAGKA